jgi:hypothetical protein
MNLLKTLLAKVAASARPNAAQSSFVNALDAPLLALNPEGDVLRARDFFEGIFAFGATGSGKSSGVGAACARAMLRAGWGGVVLCAKPDEGARWVQEAHACGRAADVVHMRPGSGWTFNFIEHELRRPTGLGAEVFNLVQLIMVVVESMRVARGHPAQGEGDFWDAAQRELLANAIDPLVAATGRFRLDELMRFITSAPTSAQDMYDAEWRARSFFFWVLQQAHDAPAGPRMSPVSMQATADYWFGTYANLDPKTRSNVVATLTATISPFLRGALHDTFCTDTTVVPELAHEGAIILVDWPIKTTGIAGAMAGQIMKYCWQRATEARAVGPHTRPTFLYIDEAQLFMSRYDPEFQSTARSSMAATVYLTQNLPNYYALQPGRDPKAATDGLLGNFQTKVFHANADPTTNNYASDLVGKGIVRRANGNWSANQGWSEGGNSSYGTSYQRSESTGRNWGGGSTGSATFSDAGQASYSVGSSSQRGEQQGKSRSWGRNRSQGESWGQSGGHSSGGGWSEQMDHLLPASYFASGLRKGGPANRCLVDAVLVQGGRRFIASGGHSLKITFQQ